MLRKGSLVYLHTNPEDVVESVQMITEDDYLEFLGNNGQFMRQDERSVVNDYIKLHQNFPKEALVHDVVNLFKVSYASAVNCVKKFADNKGETHPDEEFDKEQLKMGIKVEMEHTDNPELAKKISKDHLLEFPDYYTRLNAMEEEAKEELGKSTKEEEPEKEIEKVSAWVCPKCGKSDYETVSVDESKDMIGVSCNKCKYISIIPKHLANDESVQENIVYAIGYPYGAPLVMLRGKGTISAKDFIKSKGFVWNESSYVWEHYMDREEFLNILKELNTMGYNIIPKENMRDEYVFKEFPGARIESFNKVESIVKENEAKWKELGVSDIETESATLV
jgi:predicted nucleic-acid-binding Zn-ribbon protein